MKPLSTAFAATLTTLAERTHPSPMPQPGSISSDGRLTTLPLSPSANVPARGNLGIQAAEVLDRLSATSTPVSRPNTTKKHSASERRLLLEVLTQVFEMQKQFGKTAAELETLVEGFSWALQDFTMNQIIEAIRSYVMTKSDIPAPADVRNIIQPPPQPMSAAVYVSIRKKMIEDRVYVPSWEEAYVREFERRETERFRGGSPTLRQADAEIERWKATHGTDLGEVGE